MEATNLKFGPDTSSEDRHSAFASDEDSPVDDVAANERRLQDDLETEREIRLRLAAEYKNYRRRTEEEKAVSAAKGKRDLLNQLLSIVDDLDLALEGLNELPKSVSDGVQLIHRRFLELLEANGVIPFESIDEPFDPERHEAFDVVAAREGKAGTVFKEMRRGYLWNDKLLRPALVVVEQ